LAEETETPEENHQPAASQQYHIYWNLGTASYICYLIFNILQSMYSTTKIFIFFRNQSPPQNRDQELMTPPGLNNTAHERHIFRFLGCTLYTSLTIYLHWDSTLSSCRHAQNTVKPVHVVTSINSRQRTDDASRFEQF
jgi:hypothetical protein